MAIAPTDGIERIKFKSGERDKLGNDLLERINNARRGMKDSLSSLETWLKFYESDLDPKDSPWEDCSNVNIPLIQSHVDTWHASINDIVLTPRPWHLVKTPTALAEVPEIKKAAMAVEDALYQVLDTLVNFRGTGDQWNLNSIVQQAGVIKLRWAEEVREVKRYQPVEDMETGAVTMKGQIVKEPKYRGPKPEIVDLTNFVIVPLTASSIDDAQIVGDKYRMTEDAIRRKIKAKAWDKAEAEWCLERLTSEASHNDEALVDDNADEREGIEKLSDFDVLWFWEVIAQYDADGDGLAEDCCFVIEADSGKIVRATTYPYFHGHRYYIAQRPFPRPRRRFLGRTLPMILEHLQREINTYHNQRADQLSLAISPPFKRLKSSDINPDRHRWGPGATIDVDMMDELEQLDISPFVPGTDIEEGAKDWAERASPINDNALGRETEGAKKTLGEVQIVSQKSSLRISDVVARIQEDGMVELAKQTLGLMYQFMTDEELQSYGISRDMLTVPWDIVPHGNIGTADKQLRRNEADFMYLLLLGGMNTPPNPLVVQNPMRVHRLTQDLLQAHERKDIENYIGTEEELQMQMRQEMLQQAAQVVAQTGQLPPGFQLQPGEEQAFAQMVQQAGMQLQQEAQAQADQQNMEREKIGLDQQNREADRELKREGMQMQAQTASMKQGGPM